MKRLMFVIVLATVVGPSAVLAADPLVGKWNTIDDKSGKVMSEVGSNG